ncbi:E3 binding domain-containing protein [Thermus islandicus]|uniref:E3 binding domain-containing protein n=1 Tax=Thermus islandicus TaxID=540988 RepID=UPI0003B7B73E|nr:E3 binding domain-containing protein [Thermus islandicus]
MEEPRITPLARRLAEENGIDWRRLKGTGPDGTIVERDILAFLAKVMAGEVDLPPVPETPPPLPPEEELKRAQEALGREGVDLADLIPEAPKAPTLQVEEVAEEELELDFLEVDLSEEEEALLLPEEEAPEPLEAWEEDLLKAEAPAEEAPEPLEAWEEEAPLAKEEGPPAAFQQEANLGLLPGTAPAPALRVLVLRKRVDLAGLEAALAAFQEAYGVAKTPLPFLLRAAEKALGELALPYPALLGRREGEGVRGLKPARGFLALFREEDGEEGEGLLCFYGEEEVHTGRPSLFLSPEGVLAASGLEASLARKLLDRVALYLERPVLLLA